MWGTTSALFQRPVFSIHLLNIKAGGYSSEHKHLRKMNHFYVVSGELEIRQWPDGGAICPDEPDRTVLRAGDSLTVPVGVWHQFRAVTDCVCLEVYEAAPVEDDIDRRSVGGVEPDPGVAGLP